MAYNRIGKLKNSASKLYPKPISEIVQDFIENEFMPVQFDSVKLDKAQKQANSNLNL